MNIAIFTIGTRDIAIDTADFQTVEKGKNTYLLLGDHELGIFQSEQDPSLHFFTEPRIAGEVLLPLMSDEIVRDALQMPILYLMLDHILDENTIDRIFIVYTDQEDGVLAKYRKRDTLFYAEVITSLLEDFPRLNTPKVALIKAGADITNVDSHYKLWATALDMNLLGAGQPDRVFLATQGGIDAINQTLTLRCIEYFGHRLTLIENNESDGVNELRFPSLFLNNLLHKRLEVAINEYHFTTLELVLEDPIAKAWATIGAALSELDLDRNGVKEAIILLRKVKHDSQLNSLHLDKLRKSHEWLMPLSLSYAKILHKRNALTDVAWRVYSTREVFLKQALYGYFGVYDDFRDGHELLAKIKKQYPALKLAKIGEPSNWQHVAEAFLRVAWPKASVKKLDDYLKRSLKVSGFRNELLHNLRTSKKESFANAIGEKGELFALGQALLTSEVFGIDSSIFAAFDLVQSQIKQAIGMEQMPLL